MRYYKKDNKIFRTPIILSESVEIVEEKEENGIITKVKKITTTYTSDENIIIENGFETIKPKREISRRIKKNKQIKTKGL